MVGRAFPSAPFVRCAIYTRKSTERGLDQAVTSLDLQREVCHSYIKSQAHRRWRELPGRYDDGGYSGSTLARPALAALLTDIEAGRVDLVVVYKIDRLTRSLLDFVRLIDVFERHDATFVSVTQNFDTSDSLGRLILNILLTFAQFERELMSDRVRDKKAALLKNGLFAGGLPPFGYLVEPGGRLVIDPERAPLVAELFERYEITPLRELVRDLQQRGITTRRWRSKSGLDHGGQPMTAATVGKILANSIYSGRVRRHGEWVEINVPPLISWEAWNRVDLLRHQRAPNRPSPDRFLAGILYDELGRRMGTVTAAPGYAVKEGYYKGQDGTVR
ncbi:recombinase family protein [Sphingomonas ginkgonis]|nr:recombinase family protein [Sphingomonas ginkgonis]